jgi:hypothetical protein
MHLGVSIWDAIWGYMTSYLSLAGDVLITYNTLNGHPSYYNITKKIPATKKISL